MGVSGVVVVRFWPGAVLHFGDALKRQFCQR